jgi:hypothetical protein
MRARGMAEGGALVEIQTDKRPTNSYSLSRNYMRSEEVGFA